MNALRPALVLWLAVALPAGVVAQDPVVRYRVPVTRHEPARGPADALVTIVAFTDFQCPFSARVQPTIDQLRQDHPNDVRIIHRNQPLPFHPNAALAAEAAMEAYAQGGDPLFWRYHDRLFADQMNLERNKLEAYARDMGIRVPALRRALDTHTHAGEIAADQLIATSLGANGTPAFFINGRLVLGAQPHDVFERVVQEEIAAAQAAIARGVPRGQVYGELTANGLTRPDALAPTPTRRIPDPSAVYAVPVGTSPVRGARDALVTVVMFTDMQCPFCARAHATMQDLLSAYGGDVRLVLKHNPLPFHPRARPAARLLVWAQAQAPGQGWSLYDSIFEHQMTMGDDDLVAAAVALGLDENGARTALADPSLDAVVDADAALAASLGATGTPSFFINGRNFRGAQPLAAFRVVVDEALVQARAAVAAGTRRDDVYASIVAHGVHEAHYVDTPPPAPHVDPPDGTVYVLPVPPAAPTRGAAHGRVVVQEFSDFQCPFCNRVEPALTALLARYGDRVTFVWRDYPLPFHIHAMEAAEAAREVLAQQGVAAFWRYHDLLFRNQSALERHDLDTYAMQLGGIDMTRFRTALDTHAHRREVQADIDAVDHAGAQIGTPSFFIDGHLMQGARPLDEFVTRLDAALGP